MPGRLSTTRGWRPRHSTTSAFSLAVVGKLATPSGCITKPSPCASSTDSFPGIVESLEALAQLAADCESFPESARLLAAASNFRASNGLARPPAAVAEYDTCVALLRETRRGGVGPRLGRGPRADGQRHGRLYAGASAVSASDLRRGGMHSHRWRTGFVALAAEGLTNPQIAERLFVARGTVKIHLSHIFSKLGVSTRAELAAAATRRSTAEGPRREHRDLPMAFMLDEELMRTR